MRPATGRGRLERRDGMRPAGDRGPAVSAPGTIRTPRPDGAELKPTMAYWFTVLEILLGNTFATPGRARPTQNVPPSSTRECMT